MRRDVTEIIGAFLQILLIKSARTACGEENCFSGKLHLERSKDTEDSPSL